MVFALDILKEILKLRLEQPGLMSALLRGRRRHSSWQHEKLVIIAMDHPARRVVSAGGQPFAMANRAQLLRRIAAVLLQPGVNGLLATPDIIEEMVLLNHVVVAHGGPNFIDNKVLVGSMNRGGLADTTFELNDPVTAYTTHAIQHMHLDAGKLLFRLYPKFHESQRTMEACVEAINGLAEHEIPYFLEPLTDSNTTDDLVRLVGVASALGWTSARRWLKLPMVEEMHRVTAATTCPIVLLGGGAPGSTADLVTKVSHAMQAGPNVRGLMIGRGVLFPQDGAAPERVAAQLAGTVHGNTEEVITWEGLTSTY